MHGYCSALTVSHADVFKGGSTTVEVLAWVLARLAGLGSICPPPRFMYSWKTQARPVNTTRCCCMPLR